MTRKAASSGAPSARSAQPAAIAARPAGIARGTFGDASEPAITARLSGAKTSPLAVCAWRTARNIAGEVVPVMASATSDPRASPGRRSSPGGRSGFGERRWTRAKRTSSSEARAQPAGASAAAEAEEHRAEAEGEGERARQVQSLPLPVAGHRSGNSAAGQRGAGEPDRDVDREHPLPAGRRW